MLDADNEVYPSTLIRLMAALDDEPGAMFAYPTIAVYEHGEAGGSPIDACLGYGAPPHGQPSSMRWPCSAAAISGSSADTPRIHVWSAGRTTTLWCRAAEAGRYGVHVPEILARYRRSAHSLLNLTELDLSVARSLIAGRSADAVARDGACGIGRRLTTAERSSRCGSS